MRPCILFLTCADEKEAGTIATTLLAKRLVFCVKRFPVSSSFLWNGTINHAHEILLMMDSVEEHFEQVRGEVAQIHSYKTFVSISGYSNHKRSRRMD